jgi:hypothetical protein
MKSGKRIFWLFAITAISFLFLQSKCKDDPPPDDPPDTPHVYTCTSNITDGCMDDWKIYTTPTGNYFNPMGEFLQSLNELASVPPEAGGPGPITCDTVTDCMQGLYAARLTSKNFEIMTGVNIFIPGYIGASVLDIPDQTIHLGKAYTLRPQKLMGYYKYSPVSNDSAEIQVMLTKYNTGLNKRDTISYDKIIIHNAVSAYTQIDRTLTYWDLTSAPDTLVLIMAASAGIDFNDLQGCAGQVGSTMWVDDLKFIFP